MTAPVHSTSLRTAMWIVALATFAVAVTALGARATYGARTTADEPQYLLSALSLAEDGDLDISDEIADRRYTPFHEVTLDTQTVELDDTGRRISPHDPLLPALLAIPMLVGGWVAAKVALAAVAAATAAATTWLAVRRLGAPVGLTALTVTAFFVAPPLVGYATQVYPEMPAALCTVVAVGACTGRLGARHVAIATLAVVALPWLSVKYTPVAAVIAVTLLVRLGRSARHHAAWTAAFLGAAGLVYLVAHRHLYGGWTVYAAGDHFVDGEFTVVGTDPDYVGRSRRLAGLVLDDTFGLAAWTPALLAIPAALGVAVARGSAARHVRATLVATFATGWAVATWVALTMHGWWWPGRQVVVVLPLAVAAIAVLVDRVPVLRVPVLAGAAIGLVNWSWLVVEASSGRRTLIVDFQKTSNPLYRIWALALPDHRRFDGTDVALSVLWLVALAALTVFSLRRSITGTSGAPAPVGAGREATGPGGHAPHDGPGVADPPTGPGAPGVDRQRGDLPVSSS